MSEKKTYNKKQFISSTKTGAAGFILSVLLLLPAALLLYTDTMELESTYWLVFLCTLLSCLLGQMLFHRKHRGRGAVIHLLVSVGGFILLLAVFSASVPGGSMEMNRMIPIIIASFLGNGAGTFIGFNKTYMRNRKKSKRYTNRNHSRRFT